MYTRGRLSEALPSAVLLPGQLAWSCSPPHPLVERTKVRQKLGALLSRHHQYCTTDCSRQHVSPLLALFALNRAWKRPFLLLSLALSSKPQVILVLLSPPVFCFCSAFWGRLFQFLSKSLPKSKHGRDPCQPPWLLWASPPFPSHEAHLFHRQNTLCTTSNP